MHAIGSRCCRLFRSDAHVKLHAVQQQHPRKSPKLPSGPERPPLQVGPWPAVCHIPSLPRPAARSHWQHSDLHFTAHSRANKAAPMSDHLSFDNCRRLPCQLGQPDSTAAGQPSDQPTHDAGVPAARAQQALLQRRCMHVQSAAEARACASRGRAHFKSKRDCVLNLCGSCVLPPCCCGLQLAYAAYQPPATFEGCIRPWGVDSVQVIQKTVPAFFATATAHVMRVGKERLFVVFKVRSKRGAGFELHLVCTAGHCRECGGGASYLL